MSREPEYPRLCISKKRQDAVYAAIHEGLMQTRIALQRRPDITDGIDTQVAQAEHLIWRLVSEALKPRRSR